MISHGIVSGALFLCVGVVYDRMHTREIAAYGGLVNRMPLYAAVFMVFTLANVGLPGTSGFVGEFLALIGTFKINIAVATLATFGVILSAAYALWLYRKMIFGTLKPALAGIKDIGWREAVIFAPLVVLTILFGRCAQAGARHVGGLGRAAARQLQPRCRGRRAKTNGARRWNEDHAPNDPGERRPMNQLTQIAALLPVLPEIVLAVRRHADAHGRRLRAPERTQRGHRQRLVHRRAGAGRVGPGVDAGRPHVMFGGSFVVDDYARFLKLLALIGSAGALMLSLDYLTLEKQQKFEYGVLFLLSTLGMMMLISAADLIALYLGLELMSLPLYVVAASNRDSVRSTEAGLKYFVLGALSSGMLLYGASLIYGFTGTVSFAGIAKATANGANIGLIFGLVFLFVGFCFKISAVPFHMWTPDVYEGAPTPVTAFFAAAPKVAGIAIFVRATVIAFPGIIHEWQQIVVFVAIASMALGAFAAIGQRNIKRLMAYSSIGHMGYALVGLAAGTPEGVQGVLVYMSIYVAMTLGTFACILAMRRDGMLVENISDLAGLARTHPTMAFFLAMLLFSLAGIPPLAGFFAKFYVFLAAIKAGLYVLAVIGVLTSVVGAYYYLTIVKIMYFDEPVKSFQSMPALLRLVLGVAGLINILFFAYPAPLLGAATVAAKSLF